MDNDPQHTYRTLHMLVKHGDLGANAVTLGVLLLALLAIVLTASWWALPVALFGTALVYIVARSYVELVRVIVDMLLPK